MRHTRRSSSSRSGLRRVGDAMKSIADGVGSITHGIMGSFGYAATIRYVSTDDHSWLREYAGYLSDRPSLVVALGAGSIFFAGEKNYAMSERSGGERGVNIAHAIGTIAAWGGVEAMGMIPDEVAGIPTEGSARLAKWTLIGAASMQAAYLAYRANKER